MSTPMAPAVVICGSLSQPADLAAAKAAAEAAGGRVLAWPTGERMPTTDAYRIWSSAIRNADEVVVVPKPDGSLGEETYDEVRYAMFLRRPVRIWLGAPQQVVGEPAQPAAATVHSGPVAYDASGCHTPQFPLQEELRAIYRGGGPVAKMAGAICALMDQATAAGYEATDGDLVDYFEQALRDARVTPDFNPAYRVARCGQGSSHDPHIVDHGPDEPRNCPGTRSSTWPTGGLFTPRSAAEVVVRALGQLQQHQRDVRERL